MELSKCGCFTG